MMYKDHKISNEIRQNEPTKMYFNLCKIFTQTISITIDHILKSPLEKKERERFFYTHFLSLSFLLLSFSLHLFVGRKKWCDSFGDLRAHGELRQMTIVFNFVSLFIFHFIFSKQQVSLEMFALTIQIHGNLMIYYLFSQIEQTLDHKSLPNSNSLNVLCFKIVKSRHTHTDCFCYFKSNVW